MIFIGIDDTDSLDSRGTNQLAKQLVRTVLSRFDCVRIVRHQLLYDERIPYTSKNGSASIWLETPDEPLGDAALDALFDAVADAMRSDFIPGSDPGLCVTAYVPDSIAEFGHRCQQQIVTNDDALSLARREGIRLAGLGGTHGGVIGALAAVGLAREANDGRVVYMRGVDDEFGGRQPLAELKARGVAVVDRRTGEALTDGYVNLGKKLRPNLSAGRVVLYVEPDGGALEGEWVAIKQR